MPSTETLDDAVATKICCAKLNNRPFATADHRSMRQFRTIVPRNQGHDNDSMSKPV
jgi:hypothetical protein